MTGMNIYFYTNDFLLVLATCVPSINNPNRFGYFNVNFIPCLIALFITQSVHCEYSSVNDINYIYSSIMFPREDAGGLSREYVLRIPSVS